MKGPEQGMEGPKQGMPDGSTTMAPSVAILAQAASAVVLVHGTVPHLHVTDRRAVHHQPSSLGGAGDAEEGLLLLAPGLVGVHRCLGVCH